MTNSTQPIQGLRVMALTFKKYSGGYAFLTGQLRQWESLILVTDTLNYAENNVSYVQHGYLA
jgi:hypothetical protein